MQDVEATLEAGPAGTMALDVPAPGLRGNTVLSLEPPARDAPWQRSKGLCVAIRVRDHLRGLSGHTSPVEAAHFLWPERESQSLGAPGESGAPVLALAAEGGQPAGGAAHSRRDGGLPVAGRAGRRQHPEVQAGARSHLTHVGLVRPHGKAELSSAQTWSLWHRR